MTHADPGESSRSTRETLLNRLKDAGDHGGWQRFFDAYWGLIYRTALHAGLSAAEAEDVVQETVVKLVKVLPDFQYDRERGSFKSWLLQRVWWQIRMHLRKERRRRKLLTDSGESETEEIPDESLEKLERFWQEQWEVQLAEAAIAQVKKRVSPRVYQLFDLVVSQGLPPKDVARRMGVSTMQVYLAKHRVSKALSETVKQLQEEPCR
jgi:RNA polymerase sigma factor (sigma-70 family)